MDADECRLCDLIDSVIDRISRRRRGLRMIPILGRFMEQTGPVAPTPQYKGWPLVGELLMAFKMSDSQFTTVSLGFKDKKGNPASPPAGVTISWLVDNPAVLALVPSADSLSCQVSAVGPLGTATLSMKVVDTGSTTVAAGTLEVEVDAGAATQVDLNPSPPQEQP